MQKIVTLVLLSIFFQNVNLSAQPYYAWYKRNIPTQSNINCIRQFNGSYTVAVGNNGTIIYRALNTALWSLQNSGTTVNLNSFSYIGTNEWVCGNSGVLLKSSNLGSNWISISSGTTSKLNTIQKLTGSILSVFGENGTYLQSSNGGNNWTIKPNFTGQTLNSSSAGGTNFYVCGNGGVIFKSTDFGTSWVNVSLGFSMNLNSVIFNDANTGWVAGENGFLALTTNAGVTWIQQTSGTNLKLNSISITQFPSAYAVGDAGVLLKTSNMGTNWLVQAPLTGLKLNSSYFLGTENGFAAGDNGTVYERRTDTTFIFSASVNYNYLNAYFNDRLVLNNDVSVNQNGLEWPGNTGKYLSDAMGLNIMAKVNGQLRTATSFLKSEFAPGYAQNGNYNFDERFKIYKVRESDDVNNFYWQKWGDMVPFGAPFVDVNHNGIYEPLIDKPGIKGAGETNFICVTDAADTLHHIGNGYGAGTLPLGAEIHFTYWAPHITEDTATLHYADNTVFMKYEIINKSNNVWTGTYFSFLDDGRIGNETDDYIGCDTSINLVYYYNSGNVDGTGLPREYGYNPPSYGCALYKGAFLNSNPSVDLGITSFGYFYGNSGCSSDGLTSAELYNMARGFKKDGTSWINILNNQTTKYNYSGDPETAAGWTEYNGRVLNCGGGITGATEIPSIPSHRNIVFSTGADNLTMNPGDKQVIILMQIVEKGTNNKNAVTKVKSNVSYIKNHYYSPNISINIKPVSSILPVKFALYQNYPNPFNPSTIIKFDIPKSGFVSLTMYDSRGKQVENFISESLSAGTYQYQYDASKIPSGIYFYQLKADNFLQTKKMILIK